MIPATSTAPATVPTLTPTPVPTPPVAVAQLLGMGGFQGELRPRQFDDLYSSYLGGYGGGSEYYSCALHPNFQVCEGVMASCAYEIDYFDTNYSKLVSEAMSCACNHGADYLQCYMNMIPKSCSSALLGGYEPDQFVTSYYRYVCGGDPPKDYLESGQMPVPTVVNLDFATVNVVTVTTALPIPAYDGKADFPGHGDLLQGDCASTGFTLVDAGSTMYFAGYQGCIRDRPECCPWDVKTGGLAAPTADGKALGFNFPEPANQDDLVLKKCADDYYSISGGCCPKGYFPFTRDLGGVKQCWSSATRTIKPPRLTVEKGGEDDKPTSAVVNVIFAMHYPVEDKSGGGLSTAAIAGIAAGAGVAVIAIVAIGFAIWWRRRKKNAADSNAKGSPASSTQQPAVPAGQNQPQPVPQMTQQQQPAGSGLYPVNAANWQGDRNSVISSSTQQPLAAQHTGTSTGVVSSLSSDAHSSAYYNPRQSSISSAGAVSPGPNLPPGYPTTIVEADEGRPQSQIQPQPQAQQPQVPYAVQANAWNRPQQPQQQYYYAVPQQQPQQPQVVYYQPQQQYAQPQQQFAPPQGQAVGGGYAAPAAGGYTATPPPQQQQYQPPPPGVQEMPGMKEAQEMPGDQPGGNQQR